MTAETLQSTNYNTNQLSPEQLERERREIVEQAIAERTINLCTNRAYNFGDPRIALARADTTANID